MTPRRPKLDPNLVREVEALFEGTHRVVETSRARGYGDEGVLDLGIARNPRFQLGRLITLASSALLVYTGECPRLGGGLPFLTDSFGYTRDRRIAALFSVIWCRDAAVDASLLLDTTTMSDAVAGICDDRWGFALRCRRDYLSEGAIWALYEAGRALALPELDVPPPPRPTPSKGA